MTNEQAYEILTMGSYDCSKCKDNCDECKYNIALNVAVIALKKQIRRPVVLEDKETCCPNCKVMVAPYEDINYCGICGQALDWSDNE